MPWVRTLRIMTILLASVTEGFWTILWQEVNHTNAQFNHDAPWALLSLNLDRRCVLCWTPLPALTASSPPDNLRRLSRRRGEAEPAPEKEAEPAPEAEAAAQE